MIFETSCPKGQYGSPFLPSPNFKSAVGLKCRKHKSTPAFLFSLSALSLIPILPPKKGDAQTHLGL